MNITHPEYRVRLVSDGAVIVGFAYRGEWADLFYSCLEAFADVYGLSAVDDEPMIDRMVREAKERLNSYIEGLAEMHKAEIYLSHLKQTWFYNLPKYRSFRQSFDAKYQRIVTR